MSQATDAEVPVEALDDPGGYIADNPEDFEALADSIEDAHPGFAAVIRRAVEVETGGES